MIRLNSFWSALFNNNNKEEEEEEEETVNGGAATNYKPTQHHKEIKVREAL